jgi:hypothetical protein
MSPEQARGLEIDARSDLYAMGVILYQLATGALPFSSDTPVGFLTKHVSEVPAPARARNPAISPALDAVIARALQKDPAARFASADEMRAALLACLQPAAAPAPPMSAAAGPAARPAGARRSRPAFWAFVAAMTLAVAGGGTIALLGRERVAERRGAPDTISPAQAAASTAASSPTAAPPSTSPPAPTPPAAPTPAPTVTVTATPTATVTVTSSEARPSRRDRDRARALFRKAEARRAGQDVDGAIKLYLAAEAADPGLADVQKKLALCYQLKGDRRRAAERYRRYLATDPADAERVRAVLGTLE